MFWQSILLALMWAAVQGMDTLTVSELGKVVNLTVDSSQLTVGLKVRQNVLDNSRNGYLLIYPSSEYSYEIRSGQKGDLKLRCIGVRKSVCVLNLNEEKSAISSIKGYQIEMMINCVNDCKGELGVTVADHVSTSELGSINIIMDDIDELHLEVLSNTNFDANKLRFHVGGYSKNSSIRAMTLQAFGNMNKDGWPSATSNDFHLMHIHGNEISKVIYSKDKYFCSPNSNCKYRFTMNTKDMWRVVFYAQQTGTIENIKEYESYYDILSAGSFSATTGLYKLELDQDILKQGSKVVITLDSIEGSTKLYVNPAFLPEYSKTSIYKAELSGSKQIIIGSQELRRALNHDATITTIYIMVIADTSASYFLKASYENSNDASMLDLNRPESSIILPGVMRDFALEIETVSEEEVRNLHIDLDAESQTLFLYARQCFGSTSCGFLDDRIVKDKSVPDEKNVKYNEISSSHKEINLKLRCGKKDAYSSTKVTNKITLYKCIVNIGVYSNDKINTTKNGTPFTLKVQDKSLHHLVPLNHWTPFRLESGQSLPLQFNFHRKQNLVTDYILLHIDNHFGQVDALISQKNRNPCNGHNLIGKQSLSANEQQLFRIDRQLVGDKKLSGAYYVCLKSSKLTSLSIMLQPVFKEDAIFGDNAALSTLPKLIPDQQVMGQLAKPSDILYFTLMVNLDKSEGGAVKIHITPISGSFQIFASSNDKKPDPAQNYWNTASSILEINPTDRQFVDKGLYVVGVKLNDNNHTNNGESVSKFLISYTFGDKHITLREGMPFIGELTNQKMQQYFHVRFPSSTKEITFFKTALTDLAYALFSFNITNTYPTELVKDAAMMTYTAGYTIKSDVWQKYCPASGPEKECTLFVRLAGNGATRYSVQYNVDNSPIFLPHDFPFSVPINNIEGKPLKIIFHSNKNKSVEFELRSLFQHLNYKLKWEVEQNDSLKYKFPTMDEESDVVAVGRTDYQSQFIVDNSKVVNLSENHVLLVVLYPVIEKNFMNVFHFGNPNMGGFNGFLEISSGYRNLIEGGHVSSDCKYGEWKYFRLHHPMSTEDLTVNVAMITGVAEVVVSRGIHKLPSDDYFLVKRDDYSEAVIKIDENILPPNTRFAGDYMVGVKCTSPFANFQVLYQTRVAKWVTLEIGNPITYTVSAEEATYIELPSEATSADVVLTFYSRYANLTLLAIPRKFNDSNNLDTGPEFPGEENYKWRATSDGNSAGFGKMVFKPRDEGYCTMCTYIIRVESSKTDKVEFSAIKRTDSSFVRIIEGKQFLGDLKKGENDSYGMYVPANESYFSVNLKINKGNLTMRYSTDPSYSEMSRQYIIKQKDQNEFFYINFGKMSSIFRGMMGSSIMRFIRLEALEDNTQYSFQIVSDGTMTEITTLDIQQSILGTGMNHYYYFPSEESEDIDLYFHLRYIVDRTSPDFASVLAYFPKMIKCYQVSTIEEVQNKKLDYPLEVKQSTYRHEVQINMKPRKGFVVVVIEGVMSKSISYTLELSKFGTKKLKTGVTRPDHVHGNQTKTYIIDSRNDNDQAKVHLDMCLNSVDATFVYSDRVFSNHKSADKNKLEKTKHPVTLVNDRYMADTIPIRDDADINISVQQTSNVDQGFNQDTKKYPAIYNVHHELFSKSGAADSTAGSFLVGDMKSYAEVEVYTDEDQSVKFEGLQFHQDFLKEYKDYSMLINYTLYMSKDKRMVQFMKYCDYYRIDEASEALNTSSFSSYSVQEYHTEDLHTNRGLIPIISIRPHSLSLGGLYHGVVVAEIRLWPKTDIDVYPQAKVLKVFYNEFEFEPADFSIPLLFLFSFLIILSAAFVLYILVKYRILGKLRAIKFFDNIMSEFNEEDVGNNLVLEVIDYKRHKKPKTERNTQQPETAVSQNESAADLHESTGEDNDTTAA